MLSTIRSLALGCHGFFFREGDAFTVPAAGVCGRNAKPDPTDSGWIGLTEIEDWDDKPDDDDEKKVYAPTPGLLVVKDVVQIKSGLNFEFTTNELTPMAIEAMYRTSQKLDVNSTQFNPNSAAPRKGWLKLQRYDQTGTLVTVFDLWVRLKVKDGFKGGDVIKPKFEALLLYSALNTATL